MISIDGNIKLTFIDINFNVINELGILSLLAVTRAMIGRRTPNLAVKSIKSTKKSVYLAVNNMQEWVSLSELLAYLGEGFAQRSVRRWLASLTEEGLIERRGQKSTTQYKAKTTPTLLKETQLLFGDEHTELLGRVDILSLNLAN